MNLIKILKNLEYSLNVLLPQFHTAVTTDVEKVTPPIVIISGDESGWDDMSYGTSKVTVEITYETIDDTELEHKAVVDLLKQHFEDPDLIPTYLNKPPTGTDLRPEHDCFVYEVFPPTISYNHSTHTTMSTLLLDVVAMGRD